MKKLNPGSMWLSHFIKAGDIKIHCLYYRCSFKSECNKKAQLK